MKNWCSYLVIFWDECDASNQFPADVVTETSPADVDSAGISGELWGNKIKKILRSMW